MMSTLINDRDLQIVRAVYEENFSESPRVKYAFLGGSLSAGLGHAFSDIDLHMVVDADDPEEFYRGFNREGRVVQVNPISVDKAKSLLAHGASYRFTMTDYSSLSLGEQGLGKLVRFALGTPLAIAEDFREVIDSLDTESVRHTVMTHHSFAAMSFAEDCLGSLQGGDPMVAIDAAELALCHGAEVLLAAAGDYYIGRKFLAARLARSSACAPFAKRVWRARNQELDYQPSVQEATRIAEGLLTLAGDMAAIGTMNGWDKPLTSVVVPELENEGPRRSPYFFPIRLSDCLILHGPDKVHRVTEPMMKVWTTLSGLRIADVPDQTRGRYPELSSNDDHKFLKAVDKLLEFGVAVS
ncbi:hypothetical protein BIV23_37185 [Streptomyces monashensis]|uniref:Polymerase nucleotidyl transferase domain-containing protein n=2 Tax=Streptomyces monashensis TaxID=1678012 RepID=A0A1S2PIH3_9ACTN|nr:hypothetical protein BIV23_37185 [Streptomyces monashensis]